jgi:hypothetical protein
MGGLLDGSSLKIRMVVMAVGNGVVIVVVLWRAMYLKVVFVRVGCSKEVVFRIIASRY